mmetsp:Transcript_59774/g.140706  ORF Transcript_59774/g.140706 Transcript_59774/m.140706 type:complete len:201 (-) Transcript_59774:1542-2144(-)
MPGGGEGSSLTTGASSSLSSRFGSGEVARSRPSPLAMRASALPLASICLISTITSLEALREVRSPTKYMFNHPWGRRGTTLSLTSALRFKPRMRRASITESSRRGSSSEAMITHGGNAARRWSGATSGERWCIRRRVAGATPERGIPGFWCRAAMMGPCSSMKLEAYVYMHIWSVPRGRRGSMREIMREGEGVSWRKRAG